MWVPFVAFGAALAVSWYATPLLREAAIRFGILDRPDGALKNHAEPVPYLGGLSVFVGYLFALALTFEFGQELLGILLAGTLMLLVGLIDDLGALSPWQKLLGESVAVLVLLKAGVDVQLVFLPPAMALLVSVLWLLAVTNAFNIIDVMDGLAAGVGAIVSLFLAALAVRSGQPMVAAMSAALGGALFGFLRYNAHPARIYLGDAGSLFVGLTLAALSMNARFTDRNVLGALAPPILLGLPLFDLAFVSAIRLQNGRSPFRGSPDHFPLRLRRAGWSVPRTAAFCYGVTAALGLVAVAVVEGRNEGVARAIIVGLGGVLVVAAAVLRRVGG